MKKGKKLYEGKAKIIYATNDKNLVIQYFKDDATAFNNQKKSTIEGKGVLNNRISEHILSNLSQIGIKNSNTPIKIIKILRKIEFVDGNKTITIEPSKISLDIDFELKYTNEFIGRQRNSVKVFESDLSDIYNSRTFCLFEDIEKLKELGLAKGGTIDNAIVVKGNQVLNQNGLRNQKEFVNHKILDCMGDLYLAGYKIIGKIVCSQGGHKLTNQLLRKVFENDENFSLIEITEKNLPNSFINKSHLRSIA